MQQTLNLTFQVPFVALMQEPAFTVPAQEPGVAGSFQLPTPTGGVAPYTFSVTIGQTPPAGWSISASGLLAWTATAATLAAGTTVSVDWISVSDSGT